MSSYANITVLGNLAADTVLRETKDGHPVCNGVIASSKRVKKADGKIEEMKVFVSFRAWGKAAQSLGKFGSKGRLMFLSGTPMTENWEKDGAKRSKIVMECETYRFLDIVDSEDDVLDGHFHE